MLRDLRQEIKDLPQPIPVVIDAHWLNGLGIIRSLALEGLRCIAVSSSPRGVGLRSKGVVGLVCPDPRKDKAGFIDFMLALGKQLPAKGVLLLTDDTFMLALAEARAQLEPYFIYSFPEIGPLTRMLDKWEQYRAAEQDCGVPIARTIPLTCPDDLERWPDTAFPAILKGRLGKAFYNTSGRQVIEVHNRAEMCAAYERFKDYDVLIQEIIPGGDDLLYTLGSYISPDGDALGIFTGRKLLQKPETYGTCREGESLPAPEVREYGLRLLKYFRFYGVSQVEFKLDPRDHQYKLIEINGRFWLWHSLATHCGVNLSAIAYRSLSGLPVEPRLEQVYGPRWGIGLFELADVANQLRRGRLGLKRFFGYLRRPHLDAVLSWSDPLPGWAYFLRLFG